MWYTTRYGQRTQKTSTGLGGSLILGTDRTSRDKRLGVFLHGQPPKLSAEKGQSMGYTRMTGKVRRVGPQKDTRL